MCPIPESRHPLFLTFTRIDTPIIQRILLQFLFYLPRKDILLLPFSPPALFRRGICRRYLFPTRAALLLRLVSPPSYPPPPHRFSVYEGNEILINFSPPPQRNALYHGVNCQHIFIEGREGKEEGITRVEYCAKHLSFSFFLFSPRERKRISKRFSPTMDKSPLPLLDENPANFELISRSISRAWSITAI